MKLFTFKPGNHYIKVKPKNHLHIDDVFQKVKRPESINIVFLYNVLSIKSDQYFPLFLTAFELNLSLYIEILKFNLS